MITDRPLFNVYCDESCHLENDGSPAMVLGAIWCPARHAQMLSRAIRNLKTKHGLDKRFEIKWTKVSAAKSDFYVDLIKLFFQAAHLHFRAVIIPDKRRLNHPQFFQTHDDWYYKMYFLLLENLLTPQHRYRIFIDIKDDWGGAKAERLREILSNAMYDFSQTIVERIQIIRSDETELLQLADLLIGALSYVNRGLAASEGKLRVISEIRRHSGYRLTHSTWLREDKLNLFRWAPWEIGQ
jgi:hypothetical protein